MPANKGLDVPYKNAKFSCNHFHIDHNRPFYPPKNILHITIVSNLSWVLQPSQEKTKKKKKNLAGGGGGGGEGEGKQSALWSM